MRPSSALKTCRALLDLPPEARDRHFNGDWVDGLDRAIVKAQEMERIVEALDTLQQLLARRRHFESGNSGYPEVPDP